MAREEIRGRLVFGEDAVPFQNGSVLVILEDTTYADVPAIAVSRLVLSSIDHDGTVGGGVAFVLYRDPVPSGRQHSLRVLIDVDGDGRMGRGDYRNAAHVPVPSGPITDLVVPVRRVR